MDYKIYFFREKNVDVDIVKMIEFFGTIDGMTQTINGDIVKIEYKDANIFNYACFYFTPTLLVPNIYKLDPKYINLKFHIEMPSFLTNYNANIIFELVGVICKTFNVAIYNPLFTNVLPFRIELLQSSYYNVKKYFLENYTKDDSKIKYTIVENRIMNDIMRYQHDNYSLQLYYKDEGIYVPKYVYLLDNNGILHLACEWQEGTATVFPPHLEIVFYKYSGQLKMIYASEVLSALEHIIDDMPGFLRGTKIFTDKQKHKVQKIMKKTKFTMVTETFISTTLDTLIDL